MLSPASNAGWNPEYTNPLIIPWDFPSYNQIYNYHMILKISHFVMWLNFLPIHPKTGLLLCEFLPLVDRLLAALHHTESNMANDELIVP